MHTDVPQTLDAPRAPQPFLRSLTGGSQDEPAPPGLSLLLSDMARAGVEFASLGVAWPWLATAPGGDGHPVLVVPGFFNDDGYTAPLRAFLRARGLTPHGWEGGPNLGKWQVVAEFLIPRVEELAQRHGGPVSLVGLSIGGLFARAVALARPDLVRTLVTLGAAVRGPTTANHIWAAYESIMGESRHGLVVPPPDVPSTSVFTRLDGINDWRTCVQAATPMSESIGILCSHHGLAHHPLAMYLIADRLAQPYGEWKPFQAPAGTQLLYQTESLTPDEAPVSPMSP